MREKSNIFNFFICPDIDIQPKVKMILADFRTTRIVNDLPDKTRSLTEDKDPVASILIKFLKKTQTSLFKAH